MKLPAPARRRSSILLVSLVDLLFVLLLFFLLAAKATQAPALPINLARATMADEPLMRLESAERCQLDGEWRSLEANIEVLQRKASVAVEVQAAAGLSVDELLPALEKLRAAGITPLLGKDT